MRSTPFDETIHLAPIPFSKSICQAAKKLKQSGLNWMPHVGCFVWDEDRIIQVPSPFPNQIYFILNLGHFLKIFNTIENFKNSVVWIPTEYQIYILAEKTKIEAEQITALSVVNDPADRLIALYDLLIAKADL